MTEVRAANNRNDDNNLLGSEIIDKNVQQMNQSQPKTLGDAVQVREKDQAEMQIAKEGPAKDTKSTKSAQDDDKRYDVLSKRLSYWIDVLRGLMMVIVISSHYHTPNSEDYSSKLDLYLPHIFVSNGWGIVRSFFLLAGFFTMLSFDKMQKKYLADTKNFIKQFVLQQFKRYFQMRAVVFMWGLGMGAVYGWLFGETGDERHYIGPRRLSYWIDFYLPIYWPNRISRNNYFVNGSTWYINSMTNIESLFYIGLFVTYFIRKKLSDLKYSLTFIIFMLVVIVAMHIFWTLEQHTDMYFYLAGVIVYWLRAGFVRTQRGHKVIDWMYADKAKNKTLVWIASLTTAYVWLLVNRIDYPYHIILLGVMVLFDLFPYGKLPNVLDMIAREMKRLQMELFITHMSFIWNVHPRFYPEIVPRDTSVIRPTYVHWFVSWLLTIQFMVFSYPVHFLSKPFESIPQWIYDLATKKERKPDFWKNYWMSVAGIGTGFILIILNQANAYGYQRTAYSK